MLRTRDFVHCCSGKHCPWSPLATICTSSPINFTFAYATFYSSAAHITVLPLLLGNFFRYFISLTLVDGVIPDACEPRSFLGATTLSSDSNIFNVKCNLDIHVHVCPCSWSFFVQTILAKCCSRLFSSILQLFIHWGIQQHVWRVCSSHEVSVGLNYRGFLMIFAVYDGCEFLNSLLPCCVCGKK